MSISDPIPIYNNLNCLCPPLIRPHWIITRLLIAVLERVLMVLTVSIKLSYDGLDEGGLWGDMSPSHWHHWGWLLLTVSPVSVPFSITFTLYTPTHWTGQAPLPHLTTRLRQHWFSHRLLHVVVARITLHAVLNVHLQTPPPPPQFILIRCTDSLFRRNVLHLQHQQF